MQQKEIRRGSLDGDDESYLKRRLDQKVQIFVNHFGWIVVHLGLVLLVHGKRGFESSFEFTGFGTDGYELAF